MKKEHLFAYAQKWAGAITKHTGNLLLVRYPASPLNSHLGNARQTELVFQTSRSVTLAASNALIAARSTAVLYLEKARASLKPFLGERWTTAWAQTGFTSNSLQLPRTNTSDVLALVRAMQSYLTANAAQQNAAAGITAVAAGALITSLEAGVTALKDAKKDQRTKRDSRNSTHKTLTEYLRDSRMEVESVLDEGDSRWLDFIDEVPGDLSAPEAVSALVAEPGLPGHVRLSFIDSLRAEAYGVYVSHGEGQPFVHVLTIHDTVADLVLTPGIDVRIRVKASNAAGQSAFSPVAEVTVPVALAEAA